MPQLALGLSLAKAKKIGGVSSPIPAFGLSLWLKADAGVTLSGANVTAWLDQSGNSNNATPTDASPTYNSSDLNSKPTISLSSIAEGTNKSFLINGNPMGASGTTAFAVVYVGDVCNEGNDNGPIFGDFGIADSSSHYPYGGDCSVYDGFASANRKGPLTAPSTITNSWSLYSVVSTENDFRDYVNGALMHSDNTNVYSNIAYDGNFYIGYSNFGYTLKGKIAEAITYNRVLTTVERQQVEAYLMNKYAIGIPVASTSSVIVANSGAFGGQYDKLELTLWSDGGNNILVWDSGDAAIPNRWSLVNQETNFITTQPTWSYQTQIPMFGWPNGETITAL